MTETWRDISGFEGSYEISDQGRVRSLPRLRVNQNGAHPFKGRVLKLARQKQNYLTVSLCKNGKQTSALVHRLVAAAFIPNPENKPQVNHIDGSPLNNSVTNLEWSTTFENMQHAYRTGLAFKPSRLTKKQVASMRRLKQHGATYREIGSMFALSTGYAYYIIAGRRCPAIHLKA